MHPRRVSKILVAALRIMFGIHLHVMYYPDAIAYCMSPLLKAWVPLARASSGELMSPYLRDALKTGYGAVCAYTGRKTFPCQWIADGNIYWRSLRPYAVAFFGVHKTLGCAITRQLWFHDFVVILCLGHALLAKAMKKHRSIKNMMRKKSGRACLHMSHGAMRAQITHQIRMQLAPMPMQDLVLLKEHRLQPSNTIPMPQAEAEAGQRALRR